MIEPVTKDIGREVLYTGTRGRDRTAKVGVITSFDLHCVYVRYGQHTTSEGNRRQDLEWVETQPNWTAPRISAA
ncbi:hypothetical protein [Taklimakanibacter deserti]|uniref:hypothetical protein n=1 Tax=Taklimakanibacter deserti TaxID=2267839 RepID=UPI0013C3F3A3